MSTHVTAIVDDFLGEMRAECSCGWVGDVVPGQSDPYFQQFHPDDRSRWKREARAQQRAAAMADGAAHVAAASRPAVVLPDPDQPVEHDPVSHASG